MASASQILAVASKEIGTKEKPSNNVKYNTEYYGSPVSGSQYPWCAVFAWWVFKCAKASELFYGGKRSAYCPTLLDFYKKKGQTVSGDYQPGDLVFFNFSGGTSAQHIGICENFDGTYITTIDGNTGVNESNGGMVARKKRHKKYICGAARPAYDGAAFVAVSEEDDDVKLPVLKRGSKNKSVGALQTLLCGYGYNVDIDCSFGPATESAVGKFQKDKNLDPDCSVGPLTWRALLGV